ISPTSCSPPRSTASCPASTKSSTSKPSVSLHPRRPLRAKAMTPAITLQIPDERLLHHFPEAACLAVLDAALAAVQGVLRAEHPTVDDLPFDPEHDIVPSLLTARLILSRAGELRELLRLYSAAVAR